MSPLDPNRGLPRRQSRLPWAGRVSLLLRAGATGPWRWLPRVSSSEYTC